jgi:hypothetical protein
LILSLAMIGLAQLVSAATTQRRLTVAQAAALQEVANQAERIAALPWDQTAADQLTRWDASAELLAELPAAACSVQVTDEPPAGGIASRRIRLEVVWSDAGGRSRQPVGLTVWKFQPEATP